MVIALLASPYGAPVLAVLSLAALAAGAGLGAAWDRIPDRDARRRDVADQLALLVAAGPLDADPEWFAAGADRLMTAAAEHGRHRKPKGGTSR